MKYGGELCSSVLSPDPHGSPKMCVTEPKGARNPESRIQNPEYRIQMEPPSKGTKGLQVCGGVNAELRIQASLLEYRSLESNTDL